MSLPVFSKKRYLTISVSRYKNPHLSMLPYLGITIRKSDGETKKQTTDASSSRIKLTGSKLQDLSTNKIQYLLFKHQYLSISF